MTQKEFIKVLDWEGYTYKIKGDKIVVTGEGYVNLSDLTSLPPDVEFRNKDNVWLTSLTSLPPGVKFNNGGRVLLASLTSLPLGVVFKNEGTVDLGSLTSLPLGVEFRNKGNVDLCDLIGGYFHKWKGNIEGIGSKSLLNLMISKEIFI
jgi:hypothetical protein